jgi:DNA-binding transcriptional LysR family regulator
MKNPQDLNDGPPQTPPTAWSGSFATVRDLEILHAVIETGKTTAAAARLGISQPAVSRTLAQLEARSGRKLFRRSGQSLAPTADALALYEETKPIFDSLARLRDFQWSEGATAQLRIAAPPTIAHCLLEPLIGDFIRQGEKIRISLEITTTPAVLELVADHRADIGIADVTTASNLKRTPLRKSHFVCVIPQDHPLAAKERISITDLHDQPLVMLVKRNPARMLVDRMCTKAGVKPRILVETSNALSAVRMTAQGVGISLVNPFPVVISPPDGVVFRAFESEIAFETAFFHAADKTPSSSAQRFVEFVRGQLPAHPLVGDP